MPRNAIYLDVTVGVDPSEDQNVLDHVGASDYDVVLVAFLEPKSPYDLFYNGSQLYQQSGGELAPVDPQLNAKVASVFAQLKNGYPTKKKLLLSMGPYQSNFDAVASDVDAFVANLVQASADLSLDGVDFDYEGVQDTTHQALVSKLATSYVERSRAAGGGKPLVTAAPYYGESWWAGVLSQAQDPAGGNCFAWWNAQFYGGETNPNPDDGAAVFARWRQAVAGANAGVADPDGFLLAGVNADSKASPVYSPQTLAELIGNVRQSEPGMGGAFVWAYLDLGPDAPAWAAAAAQALAATPG